MPADVKCITHNDKSAAGYCSRCQMPYCSDCLDVEMGLPLCKSCKGKFSQASAPAAPASPPGMGASPFNFKGKGMDDDPLGLLGGGPTSAPSPKMEPPKPQVPKIEVPKLQVPPLDLPKTPVPGPSLKPSAPLSPAPKEPIDLDSLMKDLPAVKPPLSPAAPAMPSGAPSLGGAPSPLAGSGMPDMPVVRKKNKFLSLAKTWMKYLVRRSYDMFEPLAWRLRIPTYLLLVLLAGLGVGLVAGGAYFFNKPSVTLVDSIAPVHIVKVSSTQVSEMDVTTYTDLQGQIQKMGFSPLIQMTVIQLPSPNFFDVGIKEDIGTYSEIIKVPGQITPRLSFVTVFANGIWFSTNGWQGDNQNMEYLLSEFYPKATPDDLYVKHVQAVEKLKNDKGWQVANMSENRYMMALSDHIRWFLDKKDIPGYKADLNLWH